MRRLAYFLIIIGILLIAIPLLLIKQGILEINNNKQDNIETNYKYISYNDLTDNNKKNVLLKLYSKSGTSEDTILKLDKQTYTIYELYNLDEIYKIEINNEKKILTSNLDRFKNIDFYIINSQNNIVKLNFSYTKDDIPKYDEEIINKDNWIFYYDKKELTMFGYYKTNNGLFQIKIADGNLSNNKILQEDLINLIINNIKISKEESNDSFKNLYNNSITGYIELSNEETKYEIDNNNILDLNTSFYITKWTVSDNWLSNEIELVSSDLNNILTIRESIKEYNIDIIKNSLKSNGIEELEYNGEKINIIKETNSERMQGYIKMKNNKSYTIIYNLNKSNILNTVNNDKYQFIEYTEKNIYTNNGG